MIRKVRGECKCLKQMAGGARGLISASHLTSSDDLGAHMFTTTLSFSVSRHFLFLAPTIFMISLALQYWLTKKVICEARLFTAHCSWQTGDRVIGHNFGKCKSRRDSLNDRSGFGRCPRKKSNDLEEKKQMIQRLISKIIVSFAGGLMGSFSCKSETKNIDNILI